MTHVSNNLDIRIGRVRHINECGATIDVVSAQTEDHSLDWVECSLVEDKVASQDMDW